jgi:hypothetical protein
MAISTGWPEWSRKLTPAHSTQPGGRQLRHGLLGQLAQVVAGGQDHRVDPAPPGEQGKPVVAGSR